MIEETARDVADKLTDVYASFDRDAERALAQLAQLYAKDVVFRDPLQTLNGREAFLAMNRRVVTRARRVRFEVTDKSAGADSLFLAWRMTYEPHRGPSIVFEGATHARVEGSRIIEQRDYWDLLSSVAHSIPVVRNLYTALAPRLG